MIKPEDLKYLAPWEEILDCPEGQARAERLLRELRREVSLGHPLHGLTLKAVAARRDQDDVLFEVVGSDEGLAVVHLTGRQETDSRWPRTRFFGTWEQWINAVMVPDHEDFTCGDTPWW